MPDIRLASHSITSDPSGGCRVYTGVNRQTVTLVERPAMPVRNRFGGHHLCFINITVATVVAGQVKYIRTTVDRTTVIVRYSSESG